MIQDTPSTTTSTFLTKELNETKRQTIYEINQAFPFYKMDWYPPTSVLGEHNNFIIRPCISEKGGDDAPIYIQTPACLIKEGGFHKVGRHYGLELIFSGEDFLHWIEKLEELCQKKLLEKQSDWFQTELTEEDISNLFITPYKMVKGKGGRQYSLKTNVPLDKKVKIFDENQQDISYEYHDNSFHTDGRVISIIELSGIKCSPRNFHVGFEIKQMLLIKENPLFETCLIQAPSKIDQNVIPGEKPDTHPHTLEKNGAKGAKPRLDRDKPLEVFQINSVVEQKSLEIDSDEHSEPLINEKMNIEEWTIDNVVAEEAGSVHIKSPRELALEKIKKARDLGIFKQLDKRNIQNLDMDLLSKKLENIE